MSALVVGSGAREHAILVALSRAASKPKLLCFGSANNPGVNAVCAATTVGKLTDSAAIVAFAKQHGATVAVIGPEAPLAAGVADALRAAGVPTVGPSQALAQIESSKGFALELLERHGVAGVPKFREFKSLDGAREYLEMLGEGNYVVKADGLCGGKGVKVAGDHLASIDEAVAYCEECLPHFVLCEKLRGEEFSVLSFCDGTHLAHMPAVQDHKRAYEGDQGPNTGGMGAYTCADGLLPFISQANMKAAEAINGACVRALKTELGELYRGVLYGGYMLTADKGVMLIEFNARLGDPECLNLLTLLDNSKTDFHHVCQAMASGGLDKIPVHFLPKASCCKYAVPEGYPEKPLKGGAIDLSGLKNPSMCYLGSVDKDKEGVLRGQGSRAAGVVALADDLNAAEAMAESEVSAIKGQLFHRTDVGTEALVSSRLKRMLALQAEHAPATGENRVVKIGVLGSTRGSSLQPIMRAISAGELPNVTIGCVLSNKKDSGILDRAKLHGLPSAHVPCKKGTDRATYDAMLTQQLEAHGCELILLVGFMRILSPEFCAKWRNRALNVHPSLLPAFAGGMDLEVHQAVVDAKATESGCTVHMVEEEVDGGAIVVQKKCKVLPTDTAATLKARVQPLEGPALCEAIASVASSIRLRSKRPSPTKEMEDGTAAMDVSDPQTVTRITYKSAGVDIDAGNALVDDIKPHAKGTMRPGSLGGLGGFGGLFDISACGFKDPILVSGTDGVGTKLLIAQQAGVHTHIGVDLVAMVVNDLVVQGAEPLFFLDYFATGSSRRTRPRRSSPRLRMAARRPAARWSAARRPRCPGCTRRGTTTSAALASARSSVRTSFPRWRISSVATF